MSDRRHQIDKNLIVCLYGCPVIFMLFLAIGLYSFINSLLFVQIFMSPIVSEEYEAENAIEAIVRTQQDYFLDRQTFTRQLKSLEMDSETEDYSYRILFPSQPIQTKLYSISNTDDLPAIATVAYPKRDRFRVYIGIVKIAGNSNINKLGTQSNFCQSVSSLDVLKSQENIDFGFPYFTDLDETSTPFPCPSNFTVIK